LRGLILVDEFERIYTDRDYRGEYGGQQLVLFEDGSLKLLKIVGDWSHWQGESSGWSIEDEETIQPEEAIRRYGLAKLVDGLAEEFNEATRKLEKLQVNYAKRWELIKKVEEVLQ